MLHLCHFFNNHSKRVDGVGNMPGPLSVVIKMETFSRTAASTGSDACPAKFRNGLAIFWAGA